jgi:HAD superfamily hydrolase (TIGR01509 family)
MIRGLIFDFDGLILDTEVPDYQSWQDVYQAHGCALPFATWAECIGRGSASIAFNPYDTLEAALGRPIDREQIRAQRRQRFAELVAKQPILPGVEEYMIAARRRNLMLGVASSSSRAWVSSHLIRLGLSTCVDGMACADDVTHTKPDPELYHAILATLNLQPDEAIAFEDSPHGITAAKAAGLFCVAVPNPLTCQLPLDHADLRLASLADMPLETLLTATQICIRPPTTS